MSIESIATDPTTLDVVVAGFYVGSPTLEDGPIPTASNESPGAFILRYDHAGAVRWQRSFIGPLGVVAAFSDSDVVATTSMSEAVDFGCGPVGAASSTSVVVLRLDGKDGSCVVSTTFGATQVGAMTVLGADILLAGRTDANLDLGCGEPATHPGGGFISRRHASDGTCVWGKIVTGGAFSQGPFALATDGKDAVYAGTAFTSSFVFAGHSLSPISPADSLLLKFDGDGKELWAQHWGYPEQEGNSFVTGVTVTPDQTVWIGGEYVNQIQFGSQTFGSSQSGIGLFLANVSSDGLLVSASSLSTTDQAQTSGVFLATGSSGSVALTTTFQQTLELGGQGVTSPSGYSMLLADLDRANGLKPNWVKVLPPAAPSAIGSDRCGDILVAGKYSAGLDVGCGEMQPASTNDPFWASLGP